MSANGKAGIKGFPPTVTVQPPSVETRLRRDVVGKTVAGANLDEGLLELVFEDGFILRFNLPGGFTVHENA